MRGIQWEQTSLEGWTTLIQKELGRYNFSGSTMELESQEERQLKRQIEKHKLDFGEYLYHYTSLFSFFSIVESREIWLSNTGNMNDRKEMRYFVERIEEKLKAYKRDDFFQRIYDEWL